MRAMPLPNKAIASSRSVLYLIHPTTFATLPLGFCENFGFQKQISSEAIRAIGCYIPPDVVVNSEMGGINWTRFHTVDGSMARLITPRIAEFTEFKPYSIVSMDPKDGKTICYAVDVVPQVFDLIVRGDAAIRNNYTAICRAVLLDEEVNESMGLAA